jgi:hypothetical protein
MSKLELGVQSHINYKFKYNGLEIDNKIIDILEI